MDLTPEERSLFDALAARAKALQPADSDLEAPPPEIWERIEAAVSQPDRPAATSAVLRTGEGNGTPSSRSRTWLAALAAAVILILLGAWFLRSEADDVVIARTDLLALEDSDAVVGDARLVESGAGLKLLVDAQTPDPGDDDYLEVWIIDPNVTELISLGPIRPDGTYDLPEGVDARQFPIVDISREPLDGDPTHSGASLVQGQLDFA